MKEEFGFYAILMLMITAYGFFFVIMQLKNLNETVSAIKKELKSEKWKRAFELFYGGKEK